MLIHSWANATFSFPSLPACFPWSSQLLRKVSALTAQFSSSGLERGPTSPRTRMCRAMQEGWHLQGCVWKLTTRACTIQLTLPRDSLSRPQPHLQTGMVPVTSNYKDCHVPVWLSSGDTAWLGSIVGFFNLRRKSLKIFVNCCLDHQADVTEVLLLYLGASFSTRAHPTRYTCLPVLRIQTHD